MFRLVNFVSLEVYGTVFRHNPRLRGIDVRTFENIVELNLDRWDIVVFEDSGDVLISRKTGE